jgi:hypothetical protein
MCGDFARLSSRRWLLRIKTASPVYGEAVHPIQDSIRPRLMPPIPMQAFGEDDLIIAGIEVPTIAAVWYPRAR